FIYEVLVYEDREILKGPLFNYIYFRIIIRALPEVSEIEVYVNPGAVKIIIGRNFLSTLKHSILIKYVIKIRGVNSKSLKFTE
ncbi:uncharacterized protein B0T23DRAFT_314549, partial [Neurospora hispaniola]